MKQSSIKFLLTFVLVTLSIFSYSQDYKEYLSTQWDNYYNNHPSSIKDNYQASDFIKIIDQVEFSPTSSYMKGDVNILKKGLLKLEFADMRQLSITGNFFSRSKKHDDYFQLYNLTYKKLSKEDWDSYCPYLIPLMELDGLIKLR